MSVWMISCDKDVDNKVTPTELGWEATQNVRINKVKFTKSPNFFWPFIDSTFFVDYLYNELGDLEEIKLRSNEHPDFNKTLSVSYDFDQKNSFVENKTISCFEFATSGFDFVDNKIEYDIDKVVSVDGKINVCTFGFISPSSPITRNVIFSYFDNGLLESINSYISITSSNRVGTEIREIKYDDQYNVKSFIKISHSFLLEDAIQGESFSNSIAYSSAIEVPDDLKRKVNQAVIGFNASGLEEYYFKSGDPKIYDSELFSDWLVSFGLPKYQIIPAQNVGLISSKRTIGKRFADFVDGNLVYKDIDTTVAYPYVFDPVAKTLEIAGLKIWYEVVE